MHSKKNRSIPHASIYFVIAALIFPNIALAQLQHYWSQNFNTSSAILSGSVVGGQAGVSAVYYNPAQISREDSSIFALNANLFTLKSFRFKNGIGNEEDVQDFSADVQPRFISIYIAPKNEKWLVQLAVLNRAREELKSSENVELTIDILVPPIGAENYFANYNYRSKYDDQYFGVGASHKRNKNFNFGASLFVSYRISQEQNTTSLSSFPTSDTVNFINGTRGPSYFASDYEFYRFSLWSASLIFKFGAQFKIPALPNLTFGFNITPPNIPVLGQADVTRSFRRFNIYDSAAAEFERDFELNDFHKDLGAHIKDPWSISFGAVIRNPNTNGLFTFSFEYFHRLEPYNIFVASSDNIIAPNWLKEEINGQDISSFTHSAQPVFNFALGVNSDLTKKIHLLGGFRTDFSNQMVNTFNRSIDENVANIQFNKFHLTLGSKVKIFRIDMVVGFQYTFGRRSDARQIINVTEPVEFIPERNIALAGIPQNNVRILYDEFNLFFGLSYKFVN